MQLYGANYIALVIIQFIGISHTHFLSYSPIRDVKQEAYVPFVSDKYLIYIGSSTRLTFI